MYHVQYHALSTAIPINEKEKFWFRGIKEEESYRLRSQIKTNLIKQRRKIKEEKNKKKKTKKKVIKAKKDKGRMQAEDGSDEERSVIEISPTRPLKNVKIEGVLPSRKVYLGSNSLILAYFCSDPGNTRNLCLS